MQVLFLCLTIFLWETSKECLNMERDGINWTHWVNLCSHKGWSSETRNNQRTGGQRVNNRILIDNWQCNCINICFHSQIWKFYKIRLFQYISVIWFTFNMGTTVTLKRRREILADSELDQRDSKLDLLLSKDDTDVSSGV